MSAFTGIVRWADGLTTDVGTRARLVSATTLPGHARPVFISAPPLCAALSDRQAPISQDPPSIGGIVSLFDGRVDDRAGIAARLGVSAGRCSDGALARAAFERWAADAPREMLGEFAWAVWDGANRRLMLARDPSASRALYFYRDHDLVAFSTSIRGLLALPEVPREVDEQGLAEFLALYPGQGERTVYRNILRVLPGMTLVVDADRVRHAANWEVQPRHRRGKPSEWIEEARDVFERAVRDRLPTAGPTAVSLSGGLDSSIIAGVAAPMIDPQQLLAFALVPGSEQLAVEPGWAPDGRPQLEALARRHSNLRIDYIEPPVDPVDDDPVRLFAAAGIPLGLAPNIGWLLAAWRAAQAAGVQTLMTGDEGEMSLTHGGSLPELVRQGAPARALLEAWRLARRGRGRFHHHIDIVFLGGRWTWLRRKGPRPGDWRHYSPIHPELAERAGVRELLIEEAFPGGLRHRPPGYAETVRIYLRRRWGTADNIAALRALTGVEHTSPFSDRRVLDFCLTLPESAFVRDGRFRWLARAAFGDVLPPEVRYNTVKAAQNADWFHKLTLRQERLREQLASIETSPLARRALDIPRLRALLEPWPESAEAAQAAGPAYHSTLVRGLHAGAFLRWLDPSNGG